MQIWIHDNKMKKIVALNNDIPDMLSYTNSSWHSYLDQATSTFDFTIPKFSNGKLHEDLKLINDECFVSFYVNGSYQVFYIATLQEDDFNIQLTCNNTNLEYALEYANPFNSSSAQTIEWYLNQMELLAFAAVEIGNNEIPDRKRTLTFDSQETKMNRLQSLMSKFEAEFEFKVELNRDGTYKRIVINVYQEADDTHHGIGTDRKDVVLYYSNGLKGVQVTSDKTQMFNAGVFTGKDGLNLADVEISEKNADGIEEFYSRKGDLLLHAPLSMQHYPATMKPDGQDNWIRKDFTTEYENVNDLKAYALRTLKKYAYPLVTYTASVQSGFVSQYTDLKLGDTIRIIDKNFVGGLALEARVSEMIISFDNPANNSFVFTNYRKLDNKPSSALQTRIEQVIESRLSYRIELATTGGVTFKNNEGETIIKPSLYKGNLSWTKDVTWHWTLNGVVTDGMQYRIQARDIIDTAVLTVDAFVDGKKVATTEITLTNINDGLQGPQGPQGDEGPQGPQGDEGPKGDKGDTGNGIANTVVTYGLSMSDTTEPATWSSSVPTLVKGMYLWTRTVIIYTNGESTTSYQISYIAKDADATAAIDKTKQELLEKLETVRDDSLAAVEEAKQELESVRNDSLAAVEEAKQQLTTVADDLSTAKQDLQNAVSAVDTKATNLKSDLTQAKQDLSSQAQQLQAQANAQSELTKRVSSVEKTANGTKTTVSELSKTVAQNGKDITSVTARTKVVEDDLAGTKTTLSQVKTTADSTSQKTATLETGLNGLSAKFENLSVGATNHFLDSAFETTIQKIGIFQNGNVYTPSIDTTEKYYGYNTLKIVCNDSTGVDNPKITYPALAKLKTVQQGKLPEVVTISFWGKSNTEGMVLYTRLGFTNYENSQNVTLTADWKRYIVHVRTSSDATNEWVFKFSKAGTVWIAKPQFEFSAIASDYHTAEEDTSSKVAEYKQNADQNYASLQTTVQNLDGTVQHNKTVADQTAQGFSTRIESLETYKDGETTRANQYFESAKTETARQLTAERTAIAKDYVAKSTYTSDVTGIRNDLTATTATANTIKTNLANYQASNDKAVANLQSNLQEANGNISSLKTKVEAVPGQITSAVSAVESKIPTNLDSLNLMTGTRDWSTKTNAWHMGANWSTEREEYQGLKVHSTQNGFNGSHQNIFVKNGDVVTFSFFAKATNTLSKIKVSSCWDGSSVYQAPLAGVRERDEEITITSEWKRYSKTVHITSDGSLQFRTEYNGATIPNGNTFYVAGLKLAKSSLDTGYSENPTDVASDITKLSSEIKQTADGITLLATKTELNNAKNELQSGINTATNKANSNAQTISTHTSQISALNTGLQAKVSQTDFNTLSGRVTTAENNITAKANELSSKITSVEGKIPTSVGGRNYLRGTSNEYQSYKSTNYILGYPSTDGNWNKLLDPLRGKTVTLRAYIKNDTDYPVRIQMWFTAGGIYGSTVAPHSEGWSVGTGKMSADWTSANVAFVQTGNGTNNGGTIQAKEAKLEIGNIPSDWSPAPEDTQSDITKLSSEVKQTADGMTLLATKTELNTAKNDLQSGINTATNKANAAQNTANSAQSKANSNAQTISTHTSQISALNTGLSAKVSQSDFNTLSGRVTTAENNITAKANELSSKITSVEGKIPKSASQRNLVEGTSVSWSPFVNITTNNNWRYSLATVNYGDKTGIYAGTTINIFVYLSADEIVLDSSINPSFFIQGEIIDKSGTPTWTNWDKYHPFYNKWSTNLASGNNYKIVKLSAKVSSESYSNINGFKVGVRINGVRSGKFHHRALMVTTGDVFPDSWSPAPEDAINQINSVSSEFKQTTDAIKASVTSLDNSTVKSSSLTINADGIVMKAGKSTTDVANAIGSYFAVNQNAINLFSDKINVKGSMIVNGAITGDKIQANSVDVSKISGLDATYLRAKIETAMVDWLKGKTIVADNGATKIDLLSGYINFDSDTPAIRRVTPGIPTQFVKFLKSDDKSVTTIGSNRDGSESSMNDSFAGIKITSSNLIEQTEIISDQIYFFTGAANPQGWQMSTVSGDDHRQIKLFPSGNPTKSNIYASDYFIKGSNGWVNLLDFINYFNVCLGHLQNLTGRYDIFNPFKI